MNHECLKFHVRKWTACLLLGVFALTDSPGVGCAQTPPSALTAAQTPAAGARNIRPLPDWIRLLPADQGKAELVRYEGAEGPFVVLIQDAHANTDAQRNIAGMLEHLARIQKEAGGKLFVAVESAQGSLHPEYLDFVPEFKEAGQAVAESLLDKGELSGAEFFAWNRYARGDWRRGDVRIEGVENTELFRQNLAGYRALLRERPNFSSVLEKSESTLASELTKIKNPDLNRFYRERSRRKNGHYGLRRKDAAHGDLGVYARYLQEQSLKVLEINLLDPFEQLRFPNYARMLRLQNTQVDFSAPGLEASWNKLAASLPREEWSGAMRALGYDYGIIGSGKDASRAHQAVFTPRFLAEQLELAVPQDAPSWKDDLAVRNAVRVMILQSEIDAAQLFEEMSRLENAILLKLAAGPEEKEWVRRTEAFELLKRLLYLEMTRGDLDAMKKAQPDFAEMLRALLSREDADRLLYLTYRAIDFYRQARLRDETLIENALALADSEAANPDSARPILAVVSGGFHAEGMIEILRRRQNDIVLVTPRLSEMDQGQKYERVMSGANAAVDVYFENGSPFSTKQESLLFRELIETALPRLNASAEKTDSVPAFEQIIRNHPVLEATAAAAFTRSASALPLRSEKKDIPEDPRQSSIFDALVTSARNFYTDASKPAGAERSLSRSELRASVVNGSVEYNIRMAGVPPGILNTATGELVFWEPRQRKMNTLLTRPYDDVSTILNKIANESKTLDHIWQKVMGRVGEEPRYSAASDIVEGWVRIAFRNIEEKHYKAETALEVIVKAAEAESNAEDVLPNAALTTAVEMIKTLIIPALENREELTQSEVLIEDDLRRSFIKRERDQLMVRVFEFVLRLPYGLHINPEDYDGSEREDALRLIKNERQIASARRLMLFTESLPGILRDIDQGKRSRFAINKAIEITIEPKLMALQKQSSNESKPDRALLLQRLIKILEEQRSLLEGIRDELDTDDFLYDVTELPAAQAEKKRVEIDRFQSVLNEVLRFYGGSLPADLTGFVNDFRSFVTYEVQERGRTVDYAAAKFFSVESEKVQHNLPDVKIDFLMRFFNTSQYGIVGKSGDKNLFVFAKMIRHEADFAELMMSNRARGRIAGIATLKQFAPMDAPGRVPHWFIFSRDQGILPFEAVDFEYESWDLGELKEGQVVLADGRSGKIIVNPQADVLSAFSQRGLVYQYLDSYFRERVSQTASFRGNAFEFWADESRFQYLGRNQDRPRFRDLGAQGIGLLRLEQLMGEMDRSGIEFDEMRLSAAVEEILLAISNAQTPLTIRLYDVQGDKRPKFFVQGKTEEQIQRILTTHSNVRFYLDESEAYQEQRQFGKMQIKAIYRAHLNVPRNNLRILLPNILEAGEVSAVNRLFAEAREELLVELAEEQAKTSVLDYLVKQGWTDRDAVLNVQDKAKAWDTFLEDLIRTAGETHRAQIQDFARNIRSESETLIKPAVRAALDKIQTGYMFEEVSAVRERGSIMQAVNQQHSGGEGRPFFGVGTNDLQKSILETTRGRNADIDKLHPRLVGAIADLARDANALGLHMTIEGQWGGSPRMLFAALALERDHNLKVQLVAPTDKIPELLEMVRVTTDDDLDFQFDLGERYGKASMSSMIDSILRGDIPDLDAMNLLAVQLQERIEARIVASQEFQEFRQREELRIALTRSELRDLGSGVLTTTAEFRNGFFLDENPNQPGSLQPREIAVAAVAGGIYLVTGSKQSWFFGQLMRDAGNPQGLAVRDEALGAFLGSLPGLEQVSLMPARAGFSAEVHVQLKALPNAELLLPVLAVAAAVNGSLRLNVEAFNSAEAELFEEALLTLAASKQIRLKARQIRVLGNAQTEVFASFSRGRAADRPPTALIASPALFSSVRMQAGQYLFSLDESAVSNPELFASILISVLQAMALGKQPKDYLAVHDPKLLDPERFEGLVQAVSNYLSAQRKLQISA